MRSDTTKKTTKQGKEETSNAYGASEAETIFDKSNKW